jgi:hypothetical protein
VRNNLAKIVNELLVTRSLETSSSFDLQPTTANPNAPKCPRVTTLKEIAEAFTRPHSFEKRLKLPEEFLIQWRIRRDVTWREKSRNFT